MNVIKQIEKLTKLFGHKVAGGSLDYWNGRKWVELNVATPNVDSNLNDWRFSTSCNHSPPTELTKVMYSLYTTLLDHQYKFSSNGDYRDYIESLSGI